MVTLAAFDDRHVDLLVGAVTGEVQPGVLLCGLLPHLVANFLAGLHRLIELEFSA